MKKLIALILVSMSAFLLMACSKQSNDSLDGEYYWINENRNEVAFVISGDTGTIKHGEAEGFTIDKEKSTIKLLGENIIKLTKSPDITLITIAKNPAFAKFPLSIQPSINKL